MELRRALAIRRHGRASRVVVVAGAAGLVVGLLAAAPASAESGGTGGTGTGATTGTPLAPPPPVKPKTFVTASASPYQNAVMGIAQPIFVRFSSPVAFKARAEKHMRVYVSGVLSKGAWHWKDSSTAVFRPPTFWKSRSTIAIKMTLGGVVLSESSTRQFVGASTKVHTFKTSRSFVAKVDDATHRMKVYLDGKVVRTIPVSLGKPGFETRSGIKVVQEKYATRRMTSEGAGITDPNDQYDVTATWAVRITPTGEFVHGAAWAAGRIGRYDGSHGCTNVLDVDGKWFYDRVLPGDPVITVGTGRAMEYWNGPGGPWNMPWKLWLARSATGAQR
ncbi:MAG: L,D-transpeptidase [Candidatus Nanopelagicales bacterium]